MISCHPATPDPLDGTLVLSSRGGPKLVGVDLATDKAFQTIVFPPTVPSLCTGPEDQLGGYELSSLHLLFCLPRPGTRGGPGRELSFTLQLT